MLLIFSISGYTSPPYLKSTGWSAWTRRPTRTSGKDSASKGKSPVASQQVHCIPVNSSALLKLLESWQASRVPFQNSCVVSLFLWSAIFLFIYRRYPGSIYCIFFGGRICQVQVHVTVEAALLYGYVFLKNLKIVFLISIRMNLLESVIWILNIPNNDIK